MPIACSDAPPLPPPAQRCALTCVLSRAIRSGGSAGSAAASKMLCQIPCALQRWKRLKTVLAGPYSGGQSTPSTSALEHMHDPAQNAPIVLRLHATAIAWNKRLNPRPLPVAKPKQVRPHLLAPRFG